MGDVRDKERAEWHAEIEALRAEVERLTKDRDNLRDVLDYCSEDVRAYGCTGLLERAETALEGSPPDDDNRDDPACDAAWAAHCREGERTEARVAHIIREYGKGLLPHGTFVSWCDALDVARAVLAAQGEGRGGK